MLQQKANSSNEPKNTTFEMIGGEVKKMLQFVSPFYESKKTVQRFLARL